MAISTNLMKKRNRGGISDDFNALGPQRSGESESNRIFGKYSYREQRTKAMSSEAAEKNI